MGANQWTGLNDILSLAGIKYWRALWTTATQYVQGDGVRGVDGSAYVCILEHNSDATTRPNTGVNYLTYWSLLAQAGATGPTGPIGPQGPIGPIGPGGGTNTGFDAVVAADGSGNYLTLTPALTAGHKRIFIKAGTYVEAAITSAADDLYLIGENYNTVILQTTATGGGSVGYNFSGNRPYFSGLTFRGTNAVTTEYVLRVSGDQPTVERCRVDKGKFVLIHGNSSATNLLVSNSYLDTTGTAAGFGSAVDGFSIYGSKVVNSFIFTPNTSFVSPFGASNVQVDNCLIRGDKLAIICNSISNSIIQSGIMTLNFDGVNNFYSEYTYIATAPFVTINNGLHSNNYISTNSNIIKILKIDGAFSSFINNKLTYGKDIDINAEGVIFCNNQWNSTNLMQTLNVQLTASANHCQINHNVIKGEAASPIPTITDVGTNNNKISNQLYV